MKRRNHKKRIKSGEIANFQKKTQQKKLDGKKLETPTQEQEKIELNSIVSKTKDVKVSVKKRETITQKFSNFGLGMTWIFSSFKKMVPESKHEQPLFKRMEEKVEGFIDLIGKKCEVIEIEKYIVNKFLVFFNCEGETYLFAFDSETPTENQILLLKSKFFQFSWLNESVVVLSGIDVTKIKITSLPIQYIDNMRGMWGIREYLEI